jgi:threonylcarbamoyladenosine tRNA methylthiotransferase MtaB
VAEPTRAPRVAVRTLGCKVNRTESETLSEELLAAGVEIVADEDCADVVVVNTCSVTAEADAKARKAVRQALRAALEPAVIVTGCLAALDRDGLQGVHRRVVVESDKSRLAGAVCDAARTAAVGVRHEFCRTGEPRSGEGSPSEACLSGGPPRSPSAPARVFRTRATVKVQDGCDHRCAYCIVPDARGGPVSVPAKDVVGRVAALRMGGTREVVLTGINIGKYADLLGAPDFAALVEAVAATGIERIRISSIEPADLTKGLLATVSGLPAVMPHLHVPLQSGCDRTLGDMRRGYTAEEFAEAIAGAREALPGLAVTTDVIVGFPGESEEDFAQSLAFVEVPGRADPRTVADRAKAMRALGERLAASYAHARVGGRARVLVEQVGDGFATGTSEDYLHLTVHLREETPAPNAGDVVEVIVTGAERGTAWGSLAE